MMYQAWSTPGKTPRQQRAILMRESALQRPRFTQTVDGQQVEDRISCPRRGLDIPGSGGKSRARMPRNISVPHMVVWC